MGIELHTFILNVINPINEIINSSICLKLGGSCMFRHI